MDVILFLLFLGLLVYRVHSLSKLPQKTEFIEKERNCPPHKWYYADVKDTEGNVTRWKIMCKLCGPLKPLDSVDRTEV